MKKRTVILLMSLVLIFGAVVGGTVAWLSSQTTPVINTFTASNIDITLTESEVLDLKMIPGYTIKKDPKVTVKAGSEDCWLFVKIDKSSTVDTYLTYAIAEGWTAGTGNGENGNGIPTNVFYRPITNSNQMNVPYSILAGDKVSVKNTVTKEQMNLFANSNYDRPVLTFTAYAVQYYETNGKPFTQTAAWANVSATIPTNP